MLAHCGDRFPTFLTAYGVLTDLATLVSCPTEYLTMLSAPDTLIRRSAPPSPPRLIFTRILGWTRAVSDFDE